MSLRIIQKMLRGSETNLASRLLIGAGIALLAVLPVDSASAAPDEAPVHQTGSGTGHLSQVHVFAGKKVEDVKVEGLKRIEKDAVLAKISCQPGTIITSELVSGDIRKLFEMGYFDKIRVSGEKLPDGGVRLTYSLKERPVINKVDFEGNEKVSSSDLKDVIKVRDWSILDVNKVKQDVTLIQKYYEDKGYYLAKVSYEIKTVSPEEVTLIYKINDYEKVQIKKITFLNNKAFTDEQLKAQLAETQEGGFFSSIFGSGNFKDTAFKQDLQRLLLWYLDHGYIKFRYEPPVITVSDDKKWLYISIYVDEGQPYSVGSTDFSGDLLFSKEELRESLIQEPGSTFSILKRNQEIQNLTEKYQDLGYAFVNVIPKMNVHDDTRVIDFDYDFEKGNLVHIGEINVLGNNKTYDKVIRRELKIQEGQLFSGTQLRLSREAVERLGYFSPGEVIFNSKPRKDKGDVVDIEISIKERSTGTLTLGAGWGSANGFFFTGQVAEINLLGTGKSLNFSAQYAAGSPQQSFNLGFTDPYAFDSLWSAGFDVYFLRIPIPYAYTLQKKGFDLRLGHPVMDYTYGYVTYKFERLDDLPITSLGTALSGSAFEAAQAVDSGYLSSIALSVVRDLRNNRFETTAGNYQSASLEWAGWPGDMTFVKSNLNSRYYHKIWGDLVFRNNIEFGVISQYGTREMPPAQKFYLGGPNDMRGFPFYGLGPTGATGDPNNPVRPIGGSFKTLAMFELEYPVVRNFKMVVFYDIGNSWNSFPPGFFGGLRSDAGFGVRWYSPIGPIRLEWGYPIGRLPGESTSQFNFFIGPAF